MNALCQPKINVGSGAFIGGNNIVEMAIGRKIATEDEEISSLADGRFSEVRRRVQVPLPRSLEAHLVRLQKRFKKKSVAAIIQIALGFIHTMVEMSEKDASFIIEGPSGHRPFPPTILIGALSGIEAPKGTIKYQIMLSPEQDDLLSMLIARMEATSAAEVVRYAVRVLDALKENLGEEECVVVCVDGNEFELEID